MWLVKCLKEQLSICVRYAVDLQVYERFTGFVLTYLLKLTYNIIFLDVDNLIINFLHIFIVFVMYLIYWKLHLFTFHVLLII